MRPPMSRMSPTSLEVDTLQSSMAPRGEACPFIARRWSLESDEQRIDFLVSRFLGVSVVFLDLARELLCVALGRLPVVVGELSPLRFCRAAELLPLALELIGIHGELPYSDGRLGDGPRNTCPTNERTNRTMKTK